MCYVYNQWYDISCATLYIEKMKTHFYIQYRFYRKLYRLWNNVGKYGRAEQATDAIIQQATDGYKHTLKEHTIMIAFPLQQWMHESASVLHYTYTACLFAYKKHVQRNLPQPWRCAAGLDDTFSLRGTGNEKRSIKGVHHISCFPCLKTVAQPACETPVSLKKKLDWQSKKEKKKYATEVCRSFNITSASQGCLPLKIYKISVVGFKNECKLRI